MLFPFDTGYISLGLYFLYPSFAYVKFVHPENLPNSSVF